MLIQWLLVTVATSFKFDPAALSKIFHEQYADEFDDNVSVDYFLDYFSHQNSQDNAPRNTAAFSSCSQSDLKKLNVQSFGAILKCPGSQDSVSHQSECSWSCTKGAFIKHGKDKENMVKCRDGQWLGLKRAVCVESCSWQDLQKLQVADEFAHCKKNSKMGDAKFMCKVKSADHARGIKRSKRVRCSCGNSRQSGKCSWVKKGF